MESFWGVEVKPGQALTCESLKNNVIHLTQVALGETNFRRDERVSVYLCVDKKTIVLGTLTHEKCHQIGLNLIFNKTFQISHSSKYASLFFSGYSRIVPEWKQSVKRDGDSDDDEEEDEDFEEFWSSDDENESGEDEDDNEGTPKDLDTKNLRMVKKEIVVSSEDESNDDEDEDMEDVSRSDDKDEESEDEVDSSEDDEDEEYKGVCMMHAGNKRPVLTSGIKTPKTNKKARVVTPQGQKPGEGKKYVQFATHYDGANKGAKKGKRTPGGSKQQSLASEKTPKSSGTPWPGKKGHSVAKQAKGS